MPPAESKATEPANNKEVPQKEVIVLRGGFTRWYVADLPRYCQRWLTISCLGRRNIRYGLSDLTSFCTDIFGKQNDPQLVEKYKASVWAGPSF